MKRLQISFVENSILLSNKQKYYWNFRLDTIDCSLKKKISPLKNIYLNEEVNTESLRFLMKVAVINILRAPQNLQKVRSNNKTVQGLSSILMKEVIVAITSINKNIQIEFPFFRLLTYKYLESHGGISSMWTLMS